jgi:hypothetical protein
LLSICNVWPRARPLCAAFGASAISIAFKCCCAVPRCVRALPKLLVRLLQPERFIYSLNVCSALSLIW